MNKINEAYAGKKLNTKEVRDAIKADIEKDNECSVAELYKKFESEYGWAIPRMGVQKALVEWLRGLPISCAFYYNDIAEVMSKWTGDSVENQMNYIDKKGDDLYWSLIAREIEKGKKDLDKVELEESTKTSKKHVREAVDGGWEVKEEDAQRAYEFACERLGEETVNTELIRGMSSDELAAGLAFMFRMYDFHEWDEESGYNDELEDDEDDIDEFVESLKK